MPDDTASHSTGDLEPITAALWPVWWDLRSSGEISAADFIGAQINVYREEADERYNRIGDELALIEARRRACCVVQQRRGGRRERSWPVARGL